MANKVKFSMAVAISALLASGAVPAHAEGDTEPQLYVTPDDLMDLDWLKERKKKQEQALAKLDVVHDFGFTDQRKQSGITFKHVAVHDAARTYKAVHYDHGNGVLVADVDGDGLLDLYLITQIGTNELWRNAGSGRFENITAAAGVGVSDRVSVAGAFVDTDNDGDADLYVTTVKGPNLLFENDGKGRFRDISETSGLNYRGHSSGANFFDYDLDGLLDVFVSNVGTYTTDELNPQGFYVGLGDAFGGHLKPARFETSRLFRNQGGNVFLDVTEKARIADVSFSGDSTAVDVNADGYPDLYVLNMQGQDEYYENTAGLFFTKRSRELFPNTPWGAMGVKSFDYDADGDMDILITDMHSDMSVVVPPKDEKLKAPMQYSPDFLIDGGKAIYGNALFRNEGGKKFAEVSDAMGVENFWPWGPSVGDLNADGYDDLFIASSMNYPFRYGPNSLLLNDGGRKFVDVEFVLGVEPRPDGRDIVPWFDLECAGADSAHKHCSGRKDTLRVLSPLGSRSSVIFDYDGDGDLDIVVSDFNSEPMVLTSDLAQKRSVNYLQVKLIGSKSNRSGLGSKVRLHVGSKVFTKVLDGKSGYLSQSLMPLYFGLGPADHADKLEITWPSGTVQTVAGPIAAKQLLTIEEKR